MDNSKIYEKMLDSLKNGVKPALGCTEPVAVGLAVAKAQEGLQGEVEKIDVRVSPNIYKNGLGVGIPGTEEIGLSFAGLLASVCGDPNLGFQVFKPVNTKFVQEAKELEGKNIISVLLEEGEGNFFIEAIVKSDKSYGKCIIRGSHTNIVYVERDGLVLYEKKVESQKSTNGNEYLKELKIEDIRDFIENVDYNKIKFLLDGVKLNMEMAEYGLREKSGAALGSGLQELMAKGIITADTVNRARLMTSSACDARMAGVNMPVMSSAGSGNHGLTAIIPTTVVWEEIGGDEEKLARALAFSHLVTAYIKVYTGGLSPVCGCAVAAGIGAATSITWLYGGNNRQIKATIDNMIGTLTGMICDGAKGGCAFKLSTASSEAVLQSKLAMNNIFINEFDGILNSDLEKTIRDLGSFSVKGMEGADQEIINIMLSNQCI